MREDVQAGAELLMVLDDLALADRATTVSVMGDLDQAEALAFTVAHAEHPDPDVRLAVARALPSVAGPEWLDLAHPAVTTLMLLTSDEDADVRDWATFGLGTQVKVDGAAVRQCLLARADDSHEDTRAEAIAGLARRHAPGITRRIREALCADTVGRLTVESACALGDPSLAEPLAALANWWDVDVDLLEDARRRCDPARIDAEAVLVKALLDAAELSGMSLSVSSELLPIDPGDPEVHCAGAGSDVVYDMTALMRRAGGSVDAAVQLIQHDLDGSGSPYAIGSPGTR